MQRESYIRLYKQGDDVAVLEVSSKGSKITYILKCGRTAVSDFTIANGYTYSVGRSEAIRELRRFHFELVK